MSGGVAYVYDAYGSFPSLVNYEMVEVEALAADDRDWRTAGCVKTRFVTGRSSTSSLF